MTTLPARRSSTAMAEDELLPRHMLSSMRRPQLRSESSKSSNFLPLRPSPLTTRPFSGAFDDYELSPHVPVPLDPLLGIAAPRPERRRTPRTVQVLDLSVQSGEELRRPKTAPPPESVTSHESHETPPSSSQTHSATSSTLGLGQGPERGARSESTLDSSEEFGHSRRASTLWKSASFADLKKHASIFVTKPPTSESTVDLPLDSEKARSVEDEKRGRRKSIAKFVLNVFRPKHKRDKSLNIEVVQTTNIGSKPPQHD